MSHSFRQLALQWANRRILRPQNMVRFTQYLMKRAALDFPELSGVEKKEIVMETIEDILDTGGEYIRNVKQLRLAHQKLVESWIDTGIKAHKQQFQFTTRTSAPSAPPSAASSSSKEDEESSEQDVIQKISDVAEQWFKNKTVTASNVVLGITAIMQAAAKFFQGPGDVKKDMVLRVVREIVHRETTDLTEDDRDAILLAVDTFAPTVIDYLVDMSTGNFDFKGLVAKVRNACLPCSPCCGPVSSTSSSSPMNSHPNDDDMSL